MSENGGVWLYLAPMAGVTDAAMRRLCVEQGAQVTFTEMVSAKGVAYDNKKTKGLMEYGPGETRVGVQLFGREPSVLSDTAKRVQDMLGGRLYVIDVNMGCPAPKIVRNGEGCALMREPKLAGEIIAAVRAAADVPVSVKFRKGWDGGSVNAVGFARMAERSGADAVTVHGRTRDQFYSGKADWDIIREVKRAVSVKVIGNGDIFCAQDAVDMRKKTGCDAVMAARGARGNPFLFAQIRELAERGEVRTVPTARARMEACLRQARLAIEYKGEAPAMLQMRTHAPHYTKGMAHAARMRGELVKVERYAQLREIFEKYIAFQTTVW
jgi:nifR3 family TIM-barrel protein